jgi:hypothetical protein
MTWLGKILAIVVMLMTLAWMWLTAADYSTRVNWKAQREEFKKGFEEARAARESDHRRHQAELAALYKKSESIEKELIASKAERDTLATANKANKAELDRLITAAATADQQVVRLQTSLDATIKELNTVRDRNNKLEVDRQELTITREQALRDRLAALNDAKLQTKIAEDRARENDDLRALNNELKATGGRPEAIVRRSVERAPPPVPENFRGTVTAYDPARAPDLVEISLGLDAGLTFGSELDIYRLEGGGQHLGTIIVNNVYAKKAVARFKPASGLPIGRLRADQLPRVGDLVGPLGAHGGTAGLK